MEPLSWLLLQNNWIKSIYKTLPNIYHKYFFAKVLNGWKPLAIFTKISTNDVWQGPKYALVYGFSLWYTPEVFYKKEVLQISQIF